MYLENLVWDAVDPRSLGRFWEALLGAATLTEEANAFETRLSVAGGPDLDLCFQRVPAPPAEPVRLHLDLAGAAQQEAVVARALELGGSHLDIGQGDVPWVVMADPEGNPFCVMEERESYAGTGPIAALPLDSADPDRDADFWAWLTGWTQMIGGNLVSLQHPSGRGPLLELSPEPAPHPPGTKNRLHLDIRLGAGDDADAVAAEIDRRGGREEHHPEWGELPWRIYSDPSGNVFCVLPARG